MLGLSLSCYFFLCNEWLDLDRSQLCGKNRQPNRAALTAALVSTWFCRYNWANHTHGAVWNLSFWGFPCILSVKAPQASTAGWSQTEPPSFPDVIHPLLLPFIHTSYIFLYLVNNYLTKLHSLCLSSGYAGYKLCYYEVMKVIKGIVLQPYEVKGSSVFYAFSYYFDRAVESGLIGEWAQTHKESPSSAIIFHAYYHLSHKIGMEIACLFSPHRWQPGWCNWSQGF